MEKGSMLTAIEHGSVGPKRMAKAISESKTMFLGCKNLKKYHSMTRKGIRLIFLNQDGEITAGLCFGMVQLVLAVTQTSASTPSAEWGRVVFSF